ncbi:MAG TPA: hypothetical protein PK402_08675, partial [Tepidisphaeraceae bacterium]|nr:hypothetical protein [Tepidisphaeraceae bacterium]
MILTLTAPISAQPTDAQSAVFVRDSTAAQDKLSLAQRMERLKEWDTAAQVYQEVVDQYADRVLPVHKNEKGVTDRYASVASIVQDHLARWPEDGRNVYLSLFEPAAKLALEQAGDDDSALATVVNRYFVTDSGRSAAIKLFDLQFEDARFAAAGVTGDRLLRLHPELGDDAPMLILRTAIAWKFAGDESRAQAMAEKLATDFAEAKGNIGGSETNLNEWLKSTLKKQLSSRVQMQAWHTTFGGPDRAGIAHGAKISGELSRLGLLASIPIGGPIQPNPALPMDEDFIGFDNMPVDVSTDTTGTQTGVLPIADGDELFINDNHAIHAVSLITGEPLPGWASSWPASDGRFVSKQASPNL